MHTVALLNSLSSTSTHTQYFGAYQYYNIPADAEPTSPRNPLQVLKSIATHRDYVVLKLDIDTPNLVRGGNDIVPSLPLGSYPPLRREPFIVVAQ